MSVLKSMRGESTMQFVETARQLELHMFSVVTKAPKRYGPFLTGRLMELASTVHEEVRAANSIIPRNRHEAQLRRDHLTGANNALQNLSPKLTMLYDSILQNPEKCPLRAGVRFLKTKFMLTDTGSVVIRMNRASTTHIRHKLVKFRLKLGAGGMTIQDVQAAYNSYLGHMKRGNSYGVVKSTNRYFRELFDFYPDKAGWEKAIADRSESNGHHQNYI